jgi:hypothetical protein
VIIAYSPYPLVATKRVALELLRLEATSKSFLVIIDELDESFSSIRDELLKLSSRICLPFPGFVVFPSLLESAEGDPTSLAGGVSVCQKIIKAN